MTIDKSLKLAGWLGLSLLLTGLSYQAVQDYVEQQASDAVERHQQPLQYVLVSSRAVEQGQVLGEDVVVRRAYPEHLVQDHWLRPEDASNVIGLTVNRFLEKGEPITLDVLDFVESTSFSHSIEPGAYAVTAAITREQVHGGLLNVGDKVTLFANAPSMTQQPHSIANIKVLALDQLTYPQFYEQQQHYFPTTVTFLMNAKQATQFAQMQYQNYALWLQNSADEYPNIVS